MTTSSDGRVLIVDDEVELTTALCEILSNQGYETVGLTSPLQALTLLQEQDFDLLLCDLMMPEMDGVTLLRAALHIDPQLVGIIMTGQGTIQTAVEAMQVGACDYVLKPFTLHTVLPMLSRALHMRQLRRENVQLRETVAIYEMGQAIASTLDTPTILPKIAEEAMRQVGGDEASIMLPTPDGEALAVVTVHGANRGVLRGKRVPMAQSIAGWVARHRQPLTLHGVVSDPRFAPAYPRHDITAVVLPMLAGGRLLGILNINATHRRRPFTPGQVKALSIFANLAAAALSNASLYAQVRQSEERFRSVTESATDAIISADGTGRIASWNRGAQELFGYTSDDIVGRPVEVLVPVQYRDVVVSGMQRLVTAGQQRLCGKAIELCGLTHDGREFPLELSLSSWQTADGTFFSAIIRDITARKQAEEELHRQREVTYQAERLATMGQLLAGIAHELNNPLAVVLGQASLLHEDARGGLLAERAQEILRAAERCARIVRNFLALARQRPPERQQVHLNHVVQEVVELLAYTLRANAVYVHLHLADDLPPLWADPDQLHQVVLNLSTNAQQAMVETPTPRQLTFTTQFDDQRTRVILEVADTGPGILPEIAARIFEPFSTTKPLGVGTGLGLSLCKGIVEGHGGSIEAENQPERGVVFRIELPVDVAPGVAPLPRTIKVPLPLRGRTILVVDDEPIVASMLVQMLALDGHRAEVATNGAMAMDKLQHQSYDLILSDVRMPELDGPGLYRKLACRYPRLLQQIIFLTGDALGPQVQAFLEQTQVPSLDKPFTLDGLRRVMQQVLQEGTG